MEEVLGILSGWKDLSKDTLLKAFEAGNFAGVEEMRRNDRLFWRVAPLGVADISMAVRYHHDPSVPPLACPIVSLDGRLDGTIERGAMRGWGRHTLAAHTHIPIRAGDHYFVAKEYQEVGGVDRSSCGGGVGKPVGGCRGCSGRGSMHVVVMFASEPFVMRCCSWELPYTPSQDRMAHPLHLLDLFCS